MWPTRIPLWGGLWPGNPALGASVALHLVLGQNSPIHLFSLSPNQYTSFHLFSKYLLSHSPCLALLGLLQHSLIWLP